MKTYYTDEEAKELSNKDPLVIQMKKSIESVTRLLGEKDSEVIKKNLEQYLDQHYPTKKKDA